MNTTKFAEYELKRYTSQMGIYPQINLCVNENEFDKTKFKRFDSGLDDAFKITIRDNSGEIVATNPRALLMGVYHFLKIQGCRFLRPGKDGEYIPMLESTKDCEETVYAKYRHRGTTDWAISGGIDGTLEYLDWLPKAMMNTYMIEHADYYQAVLTRYRYKENPYKDEKKITRELYNRWDSEITKAIKQRGLLRHGAGHGFTIMLMDGITETKTQYAIADTKDETKCLNPEILAQVNGKRELFNGVPLNTNLCLSKEDVRKEFAQKVYECSVRHPEYDYMHVWLADSFSNFCECEECRKLNQTDWYVMLLNEIDEVFTKNNSKQKIVFLVYFELLYPPKRERIINEDRFVMLFCPFGRDFKKSFDECVKSPYTPGLNKFTWDDMRSDMYLSQLEDWKKIFKGECIAFDYSLYDESNHLDITALNQPSVTVRDTLYLEKLGIDGKIECGNYATMMPTPLMLNGVAQGLFYGTKISEKEHFEELFGKDENVYELLYSIKDAIPYDYLQVIRTNLVEDEIKVINTALEKVKKFRNDLYEFEPQHVFYRKNYEFLMIYLELVEFMYDTIIKKEKDSSFEDTRENYIEKLRGLTFRAEAVMPLYFSGIDFFNYMNAIITQIPMEK